MYYTNYCITPWILIRLVSGQGGGEGLCRLRQQMNWESLSVWQVVYNSDLNVYLSTLLYNYFE